MKTKIYLILIITLALFLRIFAIGRFPATLYGDEQAFAWNAYNILLTGEDEYGIPYPLQFRSFDDYKAPVPVYLLVPFIKFLGLNAFTIRLPIVIASVLTVLIVYFLSKLFFSEKISLIASFLMAVSPWHIHLSRGFFEATLSLLFFVLGIYFFLKSKIRFKILLLSIFFFALSVYSYFTPRILVPIFLLFLFWYGFKRNVLKVYFLSFLFLFLLCLPLIKVTFFDKGSSRFIKLRETNRLAIEKAVNRERYASTLPGVWRVVFHNKVTVGLRLIKDNYLEHLSLNFWYIFGDNSLRYFLGNMGMFHLLEAPFLIIGLYFLWKERRKAAVFFLGWILLAAIPASLVGRSFAVRSLAMLPAPFIFVGYGLYKSLLLLKTNEYRSVFSTLIAVLFTASLGSLLIRYYLEYPVYAATWWSWENKAAIDYAKQREAEYDQIFISDFYTGSTLAFAVYNQYDPLAYRYAINHPITIADGRHLIKLGKYYFGSLDIDKRRLKEGIIPPRSLYIARPEEADSDETINAPDDGRIIFKVYRRE